MTWHETVELRNKSKTWWRTWFSLSPVTQNHTFSVCLSAQCGHNRTTCCALCPHCVYPVYCVCSENQKPAVLNPELSSWLTQWPIDSLISISLSMFFKVWLCKSLFCKWPTWFYMKKKFDHYCYYHRIPCFCFRIWRTVV